MARERDGRQQEKALLEQKFSTQLCGLIPFFAAWNFLWILNDVSSSFKLCLNIWVGVAWYNHFRLIISSMDTLRKIWLQDSGFCFPFFFSLLLLKKCGNNYVISKIRKPIQAEVYPFCRNISIKLENTEKLRLCTTTERMGKRWKSPFSKYLCGIQNMFCNTEFARSIMSTQAKL